MIIGMMMAAALQVAYPMNASPSLTVLVEGVRDNAGHVRVDVCTSDEFLGKHCFASASAPATRGVTRVVVPGVAPGVYAVQAYQDRNDNQQLDRGALGVPKEDVGFSGNFRLGLQRPTFSLASFSYNSPSEPVEVKLNHFW